LPINASVAEAKPKTSEARSVIAIFVLDFGGVLLKRGGLKESEREAEQGKNRGGRNERI